MKELKRKLLILSIFALSNGFGTHNATMEGPGVILAVALWSQRLDNLRHECDQLGAGVVEWLEPQLLIADDDRDFRESLGEVFSRRGYSTRLAADGMEALQIVQESPELHLILLDVHMPRLTGIETLTKIRMERLLTTPCILMSAKLDDQIVQQASSLQISSMLSKPFSLKSLTMTVESVLRSSYGWEI